MAEAPKAEPAKAAEPPAAATPPKAAEVPKTSEPAPAATPPKSPEPPKAAEAKPSDAPKAVPGCRPLPEGRAVVRRRSDGRHPHVGHRRRRARRARRHCRDARRRAGASRRSTKTASSPTPTSRPTPSSALPAAGGEHRRQLAVERISREGLGTSTPTRSIIQRKRFQRAIAESRTVISLSVRYPSLLDQPKASSLPVRCSPRLARLAIRST